MGTHYSVNLKQEENLIHMKRETKDNRPTENCKGQIFCTIISCKDALKTAALFKTNSSEIANPLASNLICLSIHL